MLGGTAPRWLSFFAFCGDSSRSNVITSLLHFTVNILRLLLHSANSSPCLLSPLPIFIWIGFCEVQNVVGASNCCIVFEFSCRLPLTGPFWCFSLWKRFGIDFGRYGTFLLFSSGAVTSMVFNSFVFSQQLVCFYVIICVVRCCIHRFRGARPCSSANIVDQHLVLNGGSRYFLSLTWPHDLLLFCWHFLLGTGYVRSTLCLCWAVSLCGLRLLLPAFVFAAVSPIPYNGFSASVKSVFMTRFAALLLAKLLASSGNPSFHLLRTQRLCLRLLLFSGNAAAAPIAGLLAVSFAFCLYWAI